METHKNLHLLEKSAHLENIHFQIIISADLTQVKQHVTVNRFTYCD